MRAVLAGCNYSVQICDIANLSQATATSLFASGDHFIGNIDNGDGTYHAVTITGINANGTYKYNDYQNNRIGWDASASSFHSAVRVHGASCTGSQGSTGNSSGG